MANNYLITGYWGEPHVTAENDRGFNAAVFGSGKFVLPVGEMLRAEYIGNNTIRLYDGKLLDNGALAGIPAGRYIDLLIPEAGQGMNRNDLIIFEYAQDASTLIESGVFKVVSGMETSGAAVDPVLYEEDLLTDEATFDQMVLYRVPVSGANISAPVQLFTLSGNLSKISASAIDGTIASGNLPTIPRSKLAKDALYSPIKSFTTDAYSIVSDDAGKTLQTGFQSGVSATNFSINLSQEVSAKMPVGTEIAISFIYGASVKIAGQNGVRFGVLGADDWLTNATVQIVDRFNMAAIKKVLSSETSGDSWLVTGNVEVVS